MSVLAVEAMATGAVNAIGAAYDSTKWNIPTPALMFQNSGSNPEDKYIGPIKPNVARPVEQTAAIPGIYPCVVQWSSTLDWVFLADNASAAATRRIQAYTFNRATGAWAWLGFITVTWPVATNVTVVGQRAVYAKYTKGTASCAGATTAVVGTGSTWSADNLCIGSRIGFGSSDPTQITTWYEIGAIGGDTSITLTANGPNTGGSVAYVIEDLRLIESHTNATNTNGGFFMVKGLRIENFTVGGTAIASATSTDKVRASYWLADASTVTNTVAKGCAVRDFSAENSWTSQHAYVLDNSGICYAYNFRASLTLTSGKDTAFSGGIKTGVQAYTGTIQALNNGRIATPNHGPGSGVEALYFVTTTRIVRCPISGIVNSSTTWQAGMMTEVPPGGVNTFAATGALSTIDYSTVLDRFIITSSGAAGVRSYISQYREDGGQMDHICFIDSKQLDQSTADATTVPHPAIDVLTLTIWTEGGMMYVIRTGTTAATNTMYGIPIAADWQYSSSTGQKLIAPALSTPNCNSYKRATWYEATWAGGVNLGLATEPVRMYYRTSGISDNSGAWNLINAQGDLSAVAGASQIQFAFDFRIISPFMIPARILGCVVMYNDNTNDSHYQPSATFCDITNKRFAWRFATAFGGTVPTLYVRLYDATTGSLLLTDNTATPTGTWEKSTDGVTWGAYNTTDLANTTTYIRYTPVSLADSIVVKFVISLS